jgi:hypothetical protein
VSADDEQTGTSVWRDFVPRPPSSDERIQLTELVAAVGPAIDATRRRYSTPVYQGKGDPTEQKELVRGALAIETL